MDEDLKELLEEIISRLDNISEGIDYLSSGRITDLRDVGNKIDDVSISVGEVVGVLKNKR